MAEKKDVKGAKHPQETKKVPAPVQEAETPLPNAEEIVAAQARIAHMFAPHGGNPLMRRLEDLVQRLAAEGRIHG